LEVDSIHIIHGSVAILQSIHQLLAFNYSVIILIQLQNMALWLNEKSNYADSKWNPNTKCAVAGNRTMLL